MSSVLVLVLLAGGDLDAAERELLAGRPAQALETLGDLADSDDAPTRALVVLGRAHLYLKDYEAAVEPLLRASDARPDDAGLARDAAYACWGSARGRYAMAYLEDAKRMARRARDPRLSADIHYAASDFEAALEFYRAVVDDDATRLHVKTRIGECLRQMGREEEAQEALAAALEEAIRRADLQNAYRLGFAAQRTGRLLTWLDERLKKDPNDLWARLYRGYARAQALQYREAADDLRIVVRARPDDVASKERLAFALVRAGTLVRAGLQEVDDAAVAEGRGLALEVLDAQPDNDSAVEVLNWLVGSYYGPARRTADAYALAGELTRRRPDAVYLALNFCAFARRLGHYAEAEAVFLRLLDEGLDLPDVLNDYAILLDGMGRRDEAVRYWKRALEDDPSDLNALENLFTHAWERGFRDEMRDYLKRGLVAAATRNGPLERWHWFQDRLGWAPAGFGGSGP